MYFATSISIQKKIEVFNFLPIIYCFGGKFAWLQILLQNIVYKFHLYLYIEIYKY